uniref:Uncharacterized protein n=1 Tax=Caenorhabditis japonica TaxID=281687 RepID=A0A8R1IYT8_CAEJA
MKTAEKTDGIPAIGDFSQFFNSSQKFTNSLTDGISDVYAWSTALEPSDDNLPLPFVSKNEEVVWSYLKHQNKQLETVNKKFKGFLAEMIGKNHIRLTNRQDSDPENSDADNSDDVEESEDEELEDEFIDEDEEEGEEMWIFWLKESDLKNLDADLKKMAEEEDDEELDVD